MRYERLADIIRLALRLQSAGGLTLADIQEEFAVSRRTAERMRQAVAHVLGPLEAVEWHDGKRHWRLRANQLSSLAYVSAEELVELETAASERDRSGLEERADLLRSLAAKLRAVLGPAERGRLEPDLEALTLAEGLAMRPGPRPRLEPGVLTALRQAIKGGRVITFTYRSRMTGRESRDRVRPHGILYGRRAYLVGRTHQAKKMRYWVLANMRDVTVTEEMFEFEPAFDLGAFASRSFGAYQEEPFDVRLRFDRDAAPDASSFLFHPSQTLAQNDDGSLTVRFRAGGTVEMCRHLFTWGDKVTIEEPAALRRELAGLCAGLARHHGAD